MFDSLFNQINGTRRKRLSVSLSPAAELAAELLRSPDAMTGLSASEARQVVAYMEPLRLPAGKRFMQEGQTEDARYMLLILEGDVTIENIIVSRKSPITTAALTAGALIGELGLLDGSPRSASCTAATDVLAARLTREALEELIRDDAHLGIKLMMSIGTRISERMRETNDKLKRYAALTQTMQQELDRLMPT
jgi:CRP-like cAMP-binding protein